MRLWDVATGRQIGPAMTHDGCGQRRAAEPGRDAHPVVVRRQTLRLWDVATGQQIGPAMKHDGAVSGALLTKDETAHPVVVRRQHPAAVGRRDRSADRPGDDAR